MTRVDVPECARCGSDCPDLAVVCEECGEQLVERLELLARLADETETQIARQARGRPSTAGAPATREGRPMPYNADASNAAWSAANTVQTWTSEVSYRRGVAYPMAEVPPAGPLCAEGARRRVLGGAGAAECPHASCASIRHRDTTHPVARLALWLVGHVTWIRHQPDAVDAVDELLDACHLVERTVDSHRDRWYAGKCGALQLIPAAGDRGRAEFAPCAGELYALAGAGRMRCPLCGALVDVDERRVELLRKARGKALTPAELAAAATILTGRVVTSARVRGLAFRKRLLPVDPRAKELRYRLGLLVDLLEQSAPEVIDVKPRRPVDELAKPDFRPDLDKRSTSANA